MSKIGTGGIKTKIEACKECMDAGIGVIVANGALPNVLIRLIEGEDIGTYFVNRKDLA